MKRKSNLTLSFRTAITLLVMMLTSASAWAQDITLKPAIQKSYTFTGLGIKPKIDVVIYNDEEYIVTDNLIYSGYCAIIKYAKNIYAGTDKGEVIVRLYHNGEEVLANHCVLFDILPREVTLVVDDCEKFYGDADPTFTCHLDPSTTAEVQQDTVSWWNKTLLPPINYVTMTREAGEKLGTYAINTTKTVPFQYYFMSNMVTVVTPGTLTIKPNPADFSQDGNEYTIHTVTGWDNFCDLLENNDNGYFDGKTVKLGADITVSRMAGSEGHEFTGTFDGNKHTLTFNYGKDGEPTTEEHTAPFRYVGACTIKDLHVAGDIYTSAKYAAGLVAQNSGKLTIENCLSSVNIHSTVSGDGTHGGFVAGAAGQVAITGCAFNGSLLGENTEKCGGFIGWRNTGAEIRNSLFIPTEVTVKKDGSATFARNKVDTYNCYYTYELFNSDYSPSYAPYDPEDADHPDKYNNGHARHTVSGGEGVTISGIAPVGEATNTYDVSGITAYAKGIARGNEFYYGSGDEVSLTLASTAPTGFVFSSYTATAGTLSGTENSYTLTMADNDVEINAAWGITYLDENGKTQVKQAGEYTVLTGNETSLGEGWYVATGNLNYNATLNLTGDVTLILTDGCTMNIGTSESRVEGKCIGYKSPDQPSLTITSQTLGNNMGTLSAYSKGIKNQSNRCIYAYDIIINGGNVIADGDDGEHAYAIRGYNSVTINGGNVTACANGSDITSGVSAIYTAGAFRYNGGIVAAYSETGYAIEAYGCSFSWRNPDDRITFGCPILAYYGLNFNGFFTDGEGNIYVGNYQDEYIFTNFAGKTLRGTMELVLANDADNSALITAAKGKKFNVILKDRTLTKDGTWNTLCLPFSLSEEQIASSPLAGADIRELDKSTNLADDVLLTLRFKEATSISGGKPYIVRWTTTGENIVNPVFNDVSIIRYTTTEVESSDKKVKFVGQYSPFTIDADNKDEILFIGSGNKIGYSKNPRQLKSFRAHFWVQPNGFSAGARVINIDFGDGMTTSINLVEADGENGDGKSKSVYSIDGRKVQGEPTQKGVYIMNGKKVVK